MNPLPRKEARLVVDTVTVRCGQYPAVLLSAARGILGEDRYERMMADKIRRSGPADGYVYPWNVVDYLDAAGPFKPSKYVGWRWGKREDGPGHRIPARNVWLGISAEDQPRLDERYEWLVRTPAAVRFISYEPALGPIDAATWFHSSMTNAGKCAIDWLIAGGESGGGARPCSIGWIRSIIGQCHAAGVACFVKQLGANPVYDGWMPPATKNCQLDLLDKKGGDPDEWPDDLRVRQFPREVASAS